MFQIMVKIAGWNISALQKASTLSGCMDVPCVGCKKYRYGRLVTSTHCVFGSQLVTSVLFGWVAIPSAHVFESAILFRDRRKNYETRFASYNLSSSSYNISKNANSGPKWNRKTVKCTYGWLTVVNIPKSWSRRSEGTRASVSA